MAIFMVAFAVPAWPWLSGAVTIPWDAKAEFQPQLQFLATALARGQSPYWTPNVFAGWPQVADPQSLIFSPLHLALALLEPQPSFRAADAVTFAGLFLGGLGIILYFRDRGWHAGGAVVAALAFALGGAAASRLQHTGEVMSLAYLPLALWLLTRALESSSRQYGAAAGIACGLIALGRDQVALIALYLLAAFAIVRCVAAERRRERVLAAVRPLASAAVTALLVAGLPVLMTALLAAASNRPEIDYASAGLGSLHPAHLLTLAFADLYGAADPQVGFWGPPSVSWPAGLYLAQNMGQLYAGALPLVAMLTFGLAGGALWARDIRFFTVAAFVVLLYGLGWYTPAFRLIYEIAPGVGLFRRPADAAFVIGALFAILGGYATHRFLSRSLPALTAARAAIAIGCFVVVIAAAVAVAVAIGRLDVAIRPIVTGAALMAASAGVLVAARRLRHPSAAAILLGAFMAADLAWNNAPNLSTGLPPSTYEVLRPDTRNDTIAVLRTKLDAVSSSEDRFRVELSAIGYEWQNVSLVHGFDGLFGLNPLRLKAFADATGVGDAVATPEQRTFSKLFPSYRSTMADLLGLRFIATGVPAERIDKALKPGDLTLIARTGDAYVYENPRALPRVMMVTAWQIADFAVMIRTGEWPPFDPRRTVLLERPPAIRLPPSGSATAPGIAVIARYNNTEIDIDTDVPSGGLLVLHDVWHPWWRASIDGDPVNILKANVLFRAVAVPPGRHQIAFWFDPLGGALEELRAKLGI